jgi:hypothetical protein
MKANRIILVVLTSLFLSGCIKEALLLDKLRGEWSLDHTDCMVTTTADVSYMDLYSKSWTGKVTVNGIEQDCSNNRIITNMSTYFYLNPDMILDYYYSSPTIIFKNKKYDSSINWDIIKTGIIDTELTLITADNNTINIKFNLKAPVTELKKGVEYNLSDPRWKNDIRVPDLEFLSPTRIAGYVALGDMMSSFKGTWSVSSSEITLKMAPEGFSDKIIQTHNYSSNGQELTLFKNIDYNKTERVGAIPYDKIASVKQVFYYKLKN